MTESWARLDNLVLGRTFHILALTPLRKHESFEGGQLDAEDLDLFAQRLLLFLRARLAPFDINSTSSNGLTAGESLEFNNSWIHHVKAGFIEAHDNYDQELPSWAIEVEVRRPKTDGKSRNKEGTKGHVHIIFQSSAGRCSPTHYPLLLWKGPPNTIFKYEAALTQAPLFTGLELDDEDREDEERDQERELSIAASAPASSRSLVNHVLEFITRYFDCRTSQQKPMCSLRGSTLERFSEALLDNLRTAVHDSLLDDEVSAELQSINGLPLEVGYAVPAYVDMSSAGDAILAKGAAPIERGPAPDLNLVTLSVPAQVMEALLSKVMTDGRVLTYVQQYLANHTSMQLSKLTLVRVGVANVFIGSPTTTTLLGPNGQTNGEARIKLNPLLRRKTKDDAAYSSFECNRIAQVLQELGSITSQDGW